MRKKEKATVRHCWNWQVRAARLAHFVKAHTWASPSKPMRLGPYIFLVAIGTEDMSPALKFFEKKIRWHVVWFAQIMTTVVTIKSRLKFVWPQNLYFNPFFTQNPLGTTINLSIASKNRLKSQNQPEIKNQTKLRYVFHKLSR
jgi:hypothetical protein